MHNMGSEPSLWRDVCILGAISLGLFLASSSSQLQIHGTSTTASSITFLSFFLSLCCIVNVQVEKESPEFVFI